MYTVQKKHDGFCSPYKGQIPRRRFLGNYKISGQCQNFKEWLPSAYSSSRSETFVGTSKSFLKNRNWTFPLVRYFLRKLEFVSNVLRMIVGEMIFSLRSYVIKICIRNYKIFLGPFTRNLFFSCDYGGICRRNIEIKFGKNAKAKHVHAHA